MQRIRNYINGELLPPVNGAYIDNVEPATGAVYAQVPESDCDDLQKAVAAAQDAQPGWADTAADERADVLEKLAGLIDRDAEALAVIEATDNGKAVSYARAVDIYRAAANIRFFARAITQFASESHAMGSVAINYTLREPLGVVACISPWNFPLYLFTWKIAPALAAGNAVIAKPSELTPMSAHALSSLCIEAGLPPGVLNILHGSGASIGAPLTTHPAIQAVSFTGGSATGTAIKKATAAGHQKLSLELGGKNPTLVFADCDFEHTVDEVVRAAFANQGQICLCGSRVYIEAPLYARFVVAMQQRIERIRIGDPLEPDTEHGACVSAAHMNKVLGYIQLAQDEGGEVLTGGQRVHLEGRCRDGFFIAPTLIAGLGNACRTNQEEIFGPVCTVQPFDNEDHAVALANDSDFGLAASLWSSDVKRCHRVARRLQAGIVWVNCWMVRDLRTPFGGVKESGQGREGAHHGIDEYVETKYLCFGNLGK